MFENIIGNEKIKKELTNIIENKRCPQSLLFIGTSGIGKKMLAKELAKSLLCENGIGCNKCKSCVQFDSNNNPDYGEIVPDGNIIKIDQIRQMQRKISEPPIISEKKVYIIDNIDTAKKEAQNALLKTLEEPPKFLKLILIAQNSLNILSTIKSRCMCFNFENISNKQIEEYLKNTFELIDIPNSIIEAANGSIGKAIDLRDKQDLYIEIDKILNKIENIDLTEAFNDAEKIYKSQDDIYEILDYMNVAFFNQAKQNIKYLNCINYVEEAKKRLKANSNYNMTIDNLIMTIWEELH